MVGVKRISVFGQALVVFFAYVFLIGILFGQTLTGKELLVTPDFGKSDILHNEYPTKVFLSQSIKKFKLPLWNQYVATGFPQMGFPTGTFHPINILLFFFFPMPQAYSLGLASTVLIASIGTYLFCRQLGVSRVGAFIAGFCFGFSGAMVTRLVHYSVIQTISLFPWLMLSIEIAVRTKKVVWLSLFAVALGVQFLTGFYQLILYSLIVSGAYGVWRILTVSTGVQTRRNLITGFIIFLLLGWGIGAVQLLPSWEFTKNSNRSKGVTKEQVELFPYPIKHIVTFIAPYVLGDPRRGSYPMASDTWGIFWENTGYIGIIPLILSACAILFGVLRKKTYILFYAILLFCSTLLMLGVKGPLAFMYSFTPFSLFRVPSRWILFVVFSLAVLAGFGFDMLCLFAKRWNKFFVRALFAAILGAILFDLLWFDTHYHLRGPTNEWLAPTQTATYLASTKSRVYTIGTGSVWNAVFTKNGWGTGWSKQYQTLLEGLDANWSVALGIPNVGVYGVLVPIRYQIVQHLLEGTSKLQDGISREAQRILDMSGTEFLISPFFLKGSSLTEVYATKTLPTFRIWQSSSVLPRARIVHGAQKYRTTGEFLYHLGRADFDPSQTALVEHDISLSGASSSASIAHITSDEGTSITIDADASGDGILVFADTYFPGWNAYIEEKRTDIFPVNMYQRGILVPSGKHRVQFRYEPDSFKHGVFISVVSLLGLTILSIFIWKKERSYRLAQQ